MSESYLEALKATRRLCAERYPDGGWLPPGRQMAKELGVSVVTYGKALERMVWEGQLESRPRQGHYVIPSRLRLRKVGMILADGTESPFLAGLDGCVAAMTPLAVRGLHSHLIQGRLERLHDNALLHGVDGLIWLTPSSRAAESVAAIVAAGDPPLLLTHPEAPPEILATGAQLVEYDEELQAQAKAKSILARGHRRVAYVGNHEFAVKSGLAAALAAAGVELTPELCVRSASQEPGRLAALVKRHGVTGVIAEGGGLAALRLFEELAAMPEAQRPELQPFPFEGLKELQSMFPNVKVIHLELRRPGGLEALAAKIMADHLLLGKPLRSAKLAPIGANQGS